jgi:hypothetical protein
LIAWTVARVYLAGIVVSFACAPRFLALPVFASPPENVYSLAGNRGLATAVVWVEGVGKGQGKIKDAIRVPRMWASQKGKG